MLKDILNEQNIKLKPLSDKTGIPIRTLEQYSSGRRKVSLKNGLIIAKVLNVPPERLL